MDVKGEFVSTRGWMKTSTVKYFDFIKNLEKKGIKKIIFTDIKNDGMLSSPDFEIYKKIRENFEEMKIIASGGISNIEDVVYLKKIGIDGAIIGKALLEERFKISDLKNAKI